MINPHLIVRQALYDQFKSVSSLTQTDICTSARDCQASAPLAWHTEFPVEEALKLSGPLQKVFDVPLVKEVYLSGGHACFLLTEEAYKAFMAHIIAGTTLPPVADPIRNEVDYAIARMRMLARKGGEGCHDDKRVREALWLAMGILGASGTRRETRRLRAARELIGLMRGRSLNNRRQLAEGLGQAADCAARLLAYE